MESDSSSPLVYLPILQSLLQYGCINEFDHAYEIANKVWLDYRSQQYHSTKINHPSLVELQNKRKAIELNESNSHKQFNDRLSAFEYNKHQTEISNLVENLLKRISDIRDGKLKEQDLSFQKSEQQNIPVLETTTKDQQETMLDSGEAFPSKISDITSSLIGLPGDFIDSNTRENLHQITNDKYYYNLLLKKLTEFNKNYDLNTEEFRANLFQAIEDIKGIRMAVKINAEATLKLGTMADEHALRLEEIDLTQVEQENLLARLHIMSEEQQIQNEFEQLEQESPLLAEYCKAFSALLSSYFDAYRLAATVILQSNHANARSETEGRIVSAAGGIAFIVDTVANGTPLGSLVKMLETISAKIYQKSLEVRFENAVNDINLLMLNNNPHLIFVEQGIKNMVGRVALEAARFRVAKITNPQDIREEHETWFNRAFKWIDSQTHQLLESMNLEAREKYDSKAKELAFKDVLFTITRLLESMNDPGLEGLNLEWRLRLIVEDLDGIQKDLLHKIETILLREELAQKEAERLAELSEIEAQRQAELAEKEKQRLAELSEKNAEITALQHPAKGGFFKCLWNWCGCFGNSSENETSLSSSQINELIRAALQAQKDQNNRELQILRDEINLLKSNTVNQPNIATNDPLHQLSSAADALEDNHHQVLGENIIHSLTGNS